MESGGYIQPTVRFTKETALKLHRMIIVSAYALGIIAIIVPAIVAFTHVVSEDILPRWNEVMGCLETLCAMAVWILTLIHEFQMDIYGYADRPTPKLEKIFHLVLTGIVVTFTIFIVNVTAASFRYCDEVMSRDLAYIVPTVLTVACLLITCWQIIKVIYSGIADNRMWRLYAKTYEAEHYMELSFERYIKICQQTEAKTDVNTSKT